ncbi:DUF1661 domain-containing protein [Porphyromonas gulae]|uniref:DUF1661 domain-containing protein n=1 Tax=Porphyromonas gulae TaxID=111105 RepID=UPI000ABBFF0D
MFRKTWRGNFFVLVREVKILRAKVRKFSFVNFRKHAPRLARFRFRFLIPAFHPLEEFLLVFKIDNRYL